MPLECAMLFPGQASQYVGMGKDYYDSFSEVRDLYRSANRLLGFDIADMSFAGDLEALTLTHNAQPAILLHSLAVLQVLDRKGIRPAVVAGHSLGEFTALVAAGYFGSMDALLIVRRRGELMYEAGLEKPGTMAAIIGFQETVLNEVVEEAGAEGIVVVANYNSPDQHAISGEIAAVEKAVALARERGAKRAIMLQVSGAFHSPLMEKSAAALSTYMRRFDTGHLRVAWVANVTGDFVEDEAQVTDLLHRQLSSPVQWVRSMHAVTARSSLPLLEVGPGKVLTGLVKRIVPERAVHAVGSVEALQDAMGAIG